jgi:hypothetical protein
MRHLGERQNLCLGQLEIPVHLLINAALKTWHTAMPTPEIHSEILQVLQGIGEYEEDSSSSETRKPSSLG